MVLQPRTDHGCGRRSPNAFGANQFEDTPAIPFGPLNGIDGLADVLNAMDGMLLFETALCGVKEKPEASEAKTGSYKVACLKTFTWGLNFTFAGDGDGDLDADDYFVTEKDLAFGTAVSAAFEGAFDQMGDNAGVEWDVEFVTHVPEPSTALLVTLGLVGLAAPGRSRGRRAGRPKGMG